MVAKDFLCNGGTYISNFTVSVTFFLDEISALGTMTPHLYLMESQSDA